MVGSQQNQPMELGQLLSSRGIRPTQQRLAVYEYLLTHPIHPTVDTIYAALSPQYPALSRTTVYNTVYLLVQAGLARVLGGPGQEQRFDGNPEDHGHFFCLNCRQVFDFPLDQQIQPSGLEGFHALTRDLSLTGYCPDCAIPSDEVVNFNI